MDIENVELHDELEVVGEAKVDPDAGTEAQSVSATDKAGDATKQAPARKGDKKNSEPMPKTKAAMINAMYGKMNAMKKGDLQAAYGKMMGEDVEMDEAEAIAEAPEVEVTVDFSEDLNALVESEATLSDEFKAKTAVIFEAALKSKLSEEIERIESTYQEKLAEETVAQKEEMVEKVDSYLNYVVEQWMEDNQVAIQTGLRAEIAENFMNGMKELFVESYIEVPESKIDLVDDLAEQVEELEEALNKTTADAIAMSEQIEELQRSAIVAEAAADLADTQAEKLGSLVADIEFDDAESFASKVATVKESYFSKTSSVTEEVVEESTDESEATEVVESSATMDRYLQAMRTINRT
jgi:hypothetical protein